MERGTWWVTVHGVAKSQTRLSNFTFSLAMSGRIIPTVFGRFPGFGPLPTSWSSTVNCQDASGCVISLAD